MMERLCNENADTRPTGAPEIGRSDPYRGYAGNKGCRPSSCGSDRYRRRNRPARYVAFGQSEFAASPDMPIWPLGLRARTILPFHPLQSMIRSRPQEDRMALPVIGAGFGRTGTHTLNLALEMLGSHGGRQL